jgi:general secretion pathway protein M
MAISTTLNATLEKLLDRYAQMEPGDRIALSGLGLFFSLLFIYFALLNPMYSYHADSLAARDRQLGLIQYMRASEKQARSVNTETRSTASGQSLLSQVSRIAQQIGIKPNRLQPEGSDAVSVWFDSVAFNDLVKMLRQVQSQQGIVVQQISIDKEDQPGVVRARIVLRS